MEIIKPIIFCEYLNKCIFSRLCVSINIVLNREFMLYADLFSIGAFLTVGCSQSISFVEYNVLEVRYMAI